MSAREVPSYLNRLGGHGPPRPWAAAVFCVLGVLPLIVLTQVGIIVGLGILLDTFVVRTVIIPALFTLIGPRIWWPALRSGYGANNGGTPGRHRAGAGARSH